jgi:hypothetical protein
VLGSSPATRPADPAALADAQGRAIPPPPAPRTAVARVAYDSPESVLAAWIDQGVVLASRYTRTTGWSLPVALERIGGDATELALASNGHGVAMALWRHSVGQVDSLRYSRFEAPAGWGTPDVLAGALPRRPQPGAGGGTRVSPAAVPRLEIDARGNAQAQWQSGFDRNQLQASRFVAGQGWTPPQDLAAAGVQAR